MVVSLPLAVAVSSLRGERRKGPWPQIFHPRLWTVRPACWVPSSLLARPPHCFPRDACCLSSVLDLLLPLPRVFLILDLQPQLGGSYFTIIFWERMALKFDNIFVLSSYWIDTSALYEILHRKYYSSSILKQFSIFLTYRLDIILSALCMTCFSIWKL